ncbi:sugar diacid recognition domain-containing protein [Niallia endozanthoxylica]|uniref:Sugar diacid recognition n=1 Tax=Niallia endozanthoxylica TaxID=2036016 RepID=A0A5J5I2V8_9BACI|nr:sugar diacid recognition domain-containing protein [Niallia endozanthoxylica]KAA9030632.1 sugar diacid recognition [Niallia endozanthoxylica]
MRFLNQSLAQEIVNRTMKIINRNINVMNEKGVIIGSGDKKRIDSIHEGAVRVIETKSGFEISESDAEQLHGVKAGINLPINFHDKVVGVIGITGPPDEIRNYGELVKMAAEMILQQAILIDEMQWDERLKEELTIQLLNGTKNLNSLYFERVKRVGINLDIPRVAVILAADNISKGYKWIREKRESDDLYVMYSDHIILLKKIDLQGNQWVYSKTLKQIDNWILGLEKSHQLHYKMAIGNYHPGIEGISESYREAVYTLSVGNKIDPHKAIYCYGDYKLPVFLARANQLGIGEQIGPYYQQIKDHDKKGELLETLLAYVEENGDMNKVAGRLFIHRNTLRYRLERITELTKKDPRKVKDLLELYLSILQNQMK